MMGEGRSGAAAPLPLADDAAHILLVDDDRRIRDLLSRFLQRNGHRVTVAATAEEAQAHLKSFAFDLLVLDVMMPGESGIALAETVRKTSDVPILMLTALSDVDDRVRGLEVGADDYLGKPYEPRELLLRIASLLRRALQRPARPDAATLRFGPFTYSLERGELRRDDEPVRLTEREREMLHLLSATPGATVSRDALGGMGPGSNERTVDVQVNRLRRKIEADPANPAYLQTVRGIGYRLLVDP